MKMWENRYSYKLLRGHKIKDISLEGTLAIAIKI